MPVKSHSMKGPSFRSRMRTWKLVASRSCAVCCVMRRETCSISTRARMEPSITVDLQSQVVYGQKHVHRGDAEDAERFAFQWLPQGTRGRRRHDSIGWTTPFFSLAY